MKNVILAVALLAPMFSFAGTGHVGSGSVSTLGSFPVFGSDGDTLAEVNCWGVNGFTAKSPMTVVLKPSINYRSFEGTLNISEVSSVRVLLVDLRGSALLRLTLEADEQEAISSQTNGLNLGISRGSIKVSCEVNVGSQISDI